jgi:DNA replication and repair protein RecF
MRVVSVALRDFRGYEAAAAQLGGGLTLVLGANGAGKTNLLEALYFGCTGRSCRTANDRELVRFGAGTTRVVVSAEGDDGLHELAVGFTPGEPKRMSVDGASVERLLDSPHRPLVSVFLPDRLDLIKGAPALRRAHLDQFVAALWPARAASRRAYAQALAQRNALLSRIREGRGSRSSLEAWDRQMAVHAMELMANRRQAAGLVAEPFVELADRLGLDGEPGVSYRPRSRAADADGFVAELADRFESDLERGFSGHGPHRDDLLMSRGGRELRVYGSQGQQRLGLLALLLAERAAIAGLRPTVPLLLLDDVLSELDAGRRAALIDFLRDSGGQALITTTDLDQLPGDDQSGIDRLLIVDGRVHQDILVSGGRG